MPGIKAFQQRPRDAALFRPTADWLDLIWQLIKSDQYTPTLFNITNLGVGDSTAYQVPYARIGDWVGVGIRFDADAVAAGATELQITLPIPSNFTNADTDAMGCAAASSTNQSVRILADPSTNRLSAQWDVSVTSNRGYSGVAFYRIKQ